VKHHAMSDVKRIIELHQQGKTVAVTTDAGMPGISDPGAYLVRELSAQELHSLLCQASALCMSITISGLEEPWVFLGFLPLKEGKRRRELEKFLPLNVGLVIYEGPHRVGKLLSLLNELCPQRKVALLRELTKLHEEVQVGYPHELIKDSYKGEFVVVVYPITGRYLTCQQHCCGHTLW